MMVGIAIGVTIVAIFTIFKILHRGRTNIPGPIALPIIGKYSIFHKSLDIFDQDSGVLHFHFHFPATLTLSHPKIEGVLSSKIIILEWALSPHSCH